jgi:thiol-disulfide isomerase/thioredoxin
MMLPTRIPMTQERFQSGLAWPDYVAQVKMNRERMPQLFDEISLSAAERSAFAGAAARHGGQLHIAALVEDWCGDVVVILPLIARLAAEVPGVDLRLFGRAATPDLAQAYAEQGILCIPVLSFFDSGWREVTRWVERSEAAHRRVQAWKADHPQAEILRQSSQPEDRRAYKIMLKERLVEMIEWYRDGLWGSTLEELESLLSGDSQDGRTGDA